jgi:DNA (cytosine-5)-methyltransferase 1
LGLSQAGWDVRAAFDWSGPAVRTYEKNLGAHCIHAPVENIRPADLLDLANCERSEVSLVAGGPPCQGFSVQRRGPDADARSELIIEFLRIVEGVLPPMFLMENVAAARARRGRALLDEFKQTAANLGYKVSEAVLDAADFGVPQHRKRLLVIGARDGMDIRFPLPSHTPETWQTVRDSIEDLPNPFSAEGSASALPNHDKDNISELNRVRISYVPEGGGREDIPPELRLPCHAVSVATAGHRGVYGRLWWDRPAGTITTKCNSFTRGRFAHPDQNRNITMREAARLQGFPDDFVFLGSRVEVAHQVGNAVPPPLAESVGRALISTL